MRPRARPLRNLYHRYVRESEFEGVLNWSDVAEALYAEGFIDYVPGFDGVFSHYVETERMRKLPREAFDDVIREVLRKYTATKGLESLKEET
jgi:hypothetical protein